MAEGRKARSTPAHHDTAQDPGGTTARHSSRPVLETEPTHDLPRAPTQDAVASLDTDVALDSMPPPGDSSDRALSAGDRVDHFEVMRLLGRGGMGEVYVARDTLLGRKVALKLVHPRHLAMPDALSRFLTEARTTAQFSHPHIVTVHAVGEHLGRPYVALEYLEGDNLRARSRARRPSLQATLRIGVAVAEALAEAHRNGVLHLDLKPENVMIPRDGRVRVVDFGLARPAADPQRRPQDATAPVWGTPSYMAPEQWQRQPVSGQTDVWALGMLLFELCSDWLPYDLAGTKDQLAEAICDAEPVPRVDRFAAVPEELSELIARCLDKEMRRRPSATEVADTLRELLFGGWARPAEEEGPFRGLLPYTERHAALFHGREQEIAAFVERVRELPVLPVVGPSGVGKSSFVQAGVMPRLSEEEPWVFVKLRPGARPFDTLATRLVQAKARAQRADVPPPAPSSSAGEVRGRDSLTGLDTADAQRLADRLAASPRTLSLELSELAQACGAQVLLFVDQLEELFALVEQEEVRRAFVEAICSAADDPQDPVRVVFTVRDDFLGRLAFGPEVAQALAHVTVMHSLRRDALAEVLLKPVEGIGYAYEDPGLPREMVASVGGEPGGLPLLQFAARRLWEQRDPVRRMLLRSAYEEMGGVEGALATHADGVLDALSPAEVRLAQTLLLRLVTPERVRRRVARSAAVEGLEEGAGGVLQRLTEARLVVVTKGGRAGEGETMLELAHESLIRSWGTLARWLDESREERVFIDEVSQAALLWDRRGRKPEELWRGDALGDALRSRDRHGRELPAHARAFLDAAQRRQLGRLRRRRLLVGTVTGVSLVVAAAAILVAWLIADKEQEARTQRDRAEQQRAATLRESARAALGQGSALEARAKLRLAFEIEDDPAARALWWQLSSDPLVWRRLLGERLFGAAISPDGRTVAAGCHDEAVYLFDVDSAAMRVLHGNGDQVLDVAYSPDGKSLATASYNGEVKIWDVGAGAPIATLRGHTKRAACVVFSPDGRLVASGGEDGHVRAWEVHTGTSAADLAGHDGRVDDVAFSPDGKTLASASSDGSVRIWDIEGQALEATLQGHEGSVRAVAFAPDGKTLASGASDRAVRLWDVARAEPLRVLHGHEEAISSLRFAPDGRLLVSGAEDGTIRWWDVASGKTRRRLEAHRGKVSAVALSPDGEWVASVSYDHTVALWRTPPPQLDEAPFRSPRSSASATSDGLPGSRSVVFHPGGQLLASGHYDGRIRLWDVRSGELLRTFGSHTAALYDLAFSPDGSLLASASDDWSVRLWTVASGVQRRVLAGHTGGVTGVAFDESGSQLASSSKDTTLRVWDPESGRQLKILRGHSSEAYDVAYARAGPRWVSAGSNSVRAWSAIDGKEQRVVGEGTFVGVAVSPDGRRAAAGSFDGALWLWDLDSGDKELVGHHPERIYWPSFDPSGLLLGAPGSDGTARLWRVGPHDEPVGGSRPHLDLLGHRDEVNNVAFSPDGRLAATASDDGTVRLWDARSGRPFWRAPALIDHPARLLSHRGWATLEGHAAEPPPKHIRQALEERARWAGVAESSLCVLGHDGGVELWDVDGDTPLARLDDDPTSKLSAWPEGCLAIGTTQIRLLQPGGVRTTIAVHGATAATLWGDTVFVAAESEVRGYGLDGQKRRTLLVAPGVSALGVDRPWLVVGHGDGNLELIPIDPSLDTPALSFRQTPSSPPSRILAGPSHTLVVGYANGLVGLWDDRDGTRLAAARLHGQVVHASIGAGHLYVATDLGDAVSWDLGVFYSDYCELLRELWAQVPVIWSEGRAQRAPPPERHRCRP